MTGGKVVAKSVVYKYEGIEHLKKTPEWCELTKIRNNIFTSAVAQGETGK